VDDALYFVEYARRHRIAGPILDFGCGRGATVRALRAAGFDGYGADRFFDGMDWTSMRSDPLVSGEVIRGHEWLFRRLGFRAVEFTR